MVNADKACKAKVPEAVLAKRETDLPAAALWCLQNYEDCLRHPEDTTTEQVIRICKLLWPAERPATVARKRKVW